MNCTLLCLKVGESGISKGLDIFLDFHKVEGVVKCPTGKAAAALKEVEELMIPPGGAMQNWMEL